MSLREAIRSGTPVVVADLERMNPLLKYLLLLSISSRAMMLSNRATFGLSRLCPLFLLVVAIGTSLPFPARADGSGVYWSSPRSPYVADACYGKDRFVAVGGYGGIYWSTDGATWYAADSTYTGTYTSLNAVCHGNGWFVAVGRDGTILRSQDGKTWSSCISQTTKTLSSVWAANGRFVAVGLDALILVSADGYIWTSVGYTNSGSSPYPLGSLCSVVEGNGKWVALETSNTTGVWSSDGINWTRMYTGSGYEKHTIFDGTRFVAVSAGASQSAISTSTDGITWQNRNAPGDSTGICYGEGKYILVDQSGLLRSSTDLTNWTTVASASGLRRLAYGDGKFSGVGGNQRVRSHDGGSWDVKSLGGTSFDLNASCAFKSKRYVVGDAGRLCTFDFTYGALIPEVSGVTVNLRGIAANDTAIVAVGDGGVMLRSVDGVSWQLVDGRTTANLTNIAYQRGYFCAVGAGGVLTVSPDGQNWQRATTNVTEDLLSIADDGSSTLVGTSAGNVLVSSNFTSWIKRAATGTRMESLAYGNGIFVATGFYGAVWYSLDGVQWTSRASGYAGWTIGVAFGADRFVLFSQDGYIRLSPDGINWTAGRTGLEAWSYLTGANFSDGQFFAVGDYRHILYSSRTQPMELFRPALRQLEGSAFGYYMDNPADGYVFDIERSDDLQTWETVARDRTTQGSGVLYQETPQTHNGRVFYRARLSGAP